MKDQMTNFLPQARRDRFRGHLELVAGVAIAVFLRTTRALRRTEAGPTRHVLIVAPGAGSVGDQAMFEAFSERVDGRVVVVVRDDKVVPDLTTGPASEVLETPHLLYGTFLNHLRDMWRLLSAVASSQSVSVVGADVMDGAYSIRASVRRFRVLQVASHLCDDCRVLGFSWNEAPPEAARAAMRAASKRVKLLARDPVSLQRLQRDGAVDAELVADLGFLVRPADTMTTTTEPIERFIGTERDSGRSIVALNLNYTFTGKLDQVRIFAQVINHFLARNVSFVFIPHDSRGTESDVELLTQVADLAHDRAHVLNLGTTLAPREVGRVAGLTDFVVTGRMHLTILAATSYTQALSLSYQGKVEGLYDTLGLRSWMAPEQVNVDTLIGHVDELLNSFGHNRQILRESVPRLRARAELNLPGR